MTARPAASDALDVQGAIAPSGTKWLHFQKGPDSAWIPDPMLVLDERGARRRLVECGISLVGPGWKRALEKVDALRDFPPAMIIEQPGWTGSTFTLLDGTTFSPKGEMEPPVAFEIDPTKCRVGGSFKGWRSEVLRPLAGQSIPLSLLAFALAAPLLELTGRSENFGLEIVGEPRSGKSTCQFLMASMLGGTKNDHSGKYWITSDATLDGLESMMSQHSSMAMIINEANLFYADMSARARGEKLSALAFRLAQGHEKKRHQGGRPKAYRFIYVMSSNVPLASLVPTQNSAIAKAAFDRMMTLRLESTRPHGIFDFVPEGFSDADAYARDLERAAHRSHGHAIRKFLAALVEERAADPGALVDRIDALMQKFRARAETGIGTFNSRVMDAFALAFAAAELGRGYKVFPPDIYFGEALAKTYALVSNDRNACGNLDERLLALSALPGVIDLDKTKLTRIDDEAFKAVPAFLRTNRARERELLVRKRTLDQKIPGWQKLLKEPDVKTVHRRDGDRLTMKREVRSGRAGRSDRLVVLMIPPRRIKACS